MRGRISFPPWSLLLISFTRYHTAVGSGVACLFIFLYNNVYMERSTDHLKIFFFLHVNRRLTTEFGIQKPIGLMIWPGNPTYSLKFMNEEVEDPNGCTVRRDSVTSAFQD